MHPFFTPWKHQKTIKSIDNNWFNELAGNFVKEGTLAYLFSSEFSEISWNNFFIEHPRENASITNKLIP